MLRPPHRSEVVPPPLGWGRDGVSRSVRQSVRIGNALPHLDLVWRNGSSPNCHTCEKMQRFQHIEDVIWRCWRPRPELNRGTRICSPLRHHSATRPSDCIKACGGSRLERIHYGRKPHHSEEVVFCSLSGFLSSLRRLSTLKLRKFGWGEFAMEQRECFCEGRAESNLKLKIGPRQIADGVNHRIVLSHGLR